MNIQRFLLGCLETYRRTILLKYKVQMAGYIQLNLPIEVGLEWSVNIARASYLWRHIRHLFRNAECTKVASEQTYMTFNVFQFNQLKPGSARER